MRVKNNSGTEQVWVGQTLSNQSEYDIQSIEIFKWQQSDKVLNDLASGNLLIGDGSIYKSTASEAIQFLLGVNTAPKDPAGRTIVRNAATIDGWHYQLLSTEITSSKYGGYYSKDETETDLGFVTHKIYKPDGTEVTSSTDELLTTKTVIDICPAHDYEIIGALFSQNSNPSTDIRMWVTGLPGIANVKFANGGTNLKQIGSATVKLADGRASKYLPYNSSFPLASTIRLTCIHAAGVQHDFMISLELFKSL